MDKNQERFIGLIDRSNLEASLSSYKRINDKISYMIANGELIQVMRGKYVSGNEIKNGKLSLFQLSNTLYGPSYITSYSALSYYGMIPESVHTIIAATTNRSRVINSTLGQFEYAKMLESSFSVGIDYIKSGYTSFLLASPTKALVDLLWMNKSIKISSIKSLQVYLEMDLRLDMESLSLLKTDVIKECITSGKKKRVIRYLLELIIDSQDELT